VSLFRRKPKTDLPGTRQVTRSARPSTFNYSANRNEQEYNLGRGVPREQDVRRRERLVRYWRQRLGMFVAGVVLIICVLYTLHLSGNPKVVSLAPSTAGYFLQDDSVYQRAAAKAFTSSVFNNNKVTINTVGIQQKLQHQFPELSEVSVTIPLMSHRPIVYIAPTTPSLILSAADGDFVLDNNGKALIRADAIGDLDKLALPTVKDQSGVRVNSGDIALASSSVNFIRTVVAEMNAKGVRIESLTLPNAAYELDMKPAGAGYFVKFNLHEPTARQQSGTYLAVRQRLASQSITPGRYIDVRLDGRAYYK
jgi:hypothetical protein